MIVSKLKDQKAVLFALLCIGGTVTFVPPVAGQPPVGEGKGGNARLAAREQGETDRDRLQGKWQITSITMQGKVFKREDRLEGWKETFLTDLLIEGDRLGQVQHNKGKFMLDDTRIPKQITIQDADGKLTFRGIYDIDGDTLKVCMNGDGTDVRRPEEFVSKKGTPLIIITLKKSPAMK